MDNKSFNWDAIPVVAKVGADPAALTQPALSVVPAGKRWLVFTIKNTIVASADAASRTGYVVVNDGTETVFSSIVGPAVTAGLTRTQTFQAMSMITVAQLTGMHMPLFELPTGWGITINWVNLDAVAAGDDCGPVTVYVKEAPA